MTDTPDTPGTDGNGIELAKPLGVETTPIPGFLRIDLTVHGDNRGWFKEN